MDNVLNKLKHAIDTTEEECIKLQKMYEEELSHLTTWEKDWMDVSIKKNKMYFYINILNELKAYLNMGI